MFKGNSNGNYVRKNEFEVPIIAQWVRINPTRWRDRISMRVELYGCDYRKYQKLNCSSILIITVSKSCTGCVISNGHTLSEYALQTNP